MAKGNKDMRNDQEYWNKRQLALNEKLLELGDELEKELAAEFEKAEGKIVKEIEAFYTRFAVDNKISFAEAKRILTTGEKRRFMMEVDEYIKKASDYPYTPEWDKALKNASTAHRVTRLKSLQMQMRQQVEALYAKYGGRMTETAEKVFTEGYYRSLFDIQSIEGYGAPFAWLDTATIKKAVTKPWAPDGSNFSARIWKDREGLVNYLNKEMTQAFIRGEGPRRLTDEIKHKFGVTRKNAARLVQTEMSYFTTAGKLESFKEAGFRQYEILAIMDGRTSEICKALNGDVFNISDYAPGVTAPPFHVRCRTAIAPYEGEKESERAYRDDDGTVYLVPPEMTYEDWLKEHAEGKNANGSED